MKRGPDFHEGVDFRARTPLPVSAMDGGTVLYAGWRSDGFGNRVIIDHGNGMVSAYAHLSRVDVEQDQVLDPGHRLGLTGATGGNYPPHLHVEVNRGGDEALYRQGRIRYEGARHFDFEAYVPGTDLSFAGSYLDRITLERGDRMPVVRELQEDLLALGYDVNGGVATGYYGSQTEAAVRQFQIDQAFETEDVDGVFGPTTRDVLRAELAGRDVPDRRDESALAPMERSPASGPDTAPAGGRAVLDTPGPFAAVSVGDLVGTRPSEDRVAMSSLGLEGTRALTRAVFGDGVGAEVLSRLGDEHGDERTFLQRVTALGYHEGRLSFGRANADPAAGFNRSTFQEGGRHIGSQAESDAQYEARVTDGLALAERALGREIDSAALTPADRDVLAFAGYRSERSEAVLPAIDPRRFSRDPDTLFNILADPTLTREQTIEAASRLTQGGIRDIGESVADWSTPGGRELYVAPEAVAARTAEPDATRSEPAFPLLRQGDAGDGVLALQDTLRRLGHDLGTSGPDGDGVDGSFGDRTRAAVLAEQARAEFSVRDQDGVVGPGTWALLVARVSRDVAVEADAPAAEPTPSAPEAEGGGAERSAPDLDAARAALGAKPEVAGFLDQIDAYVHNLLDTHTADHRAVADRLYDAARAQSAPLSPEAVRAAAPTMTDFEARAIARGVDAAVALERQHPDVAEARTVLRDVDASRGVGAAPDAAPDRPERGHERGPQPSYAPVMIDY